MQDCIDTKRVRAGSATRPPVSSRLDWELGFRGILRLLRAAVMGTWEVPGFGGLSRIVEMRMRLGRLRAEDDDSDKDKGESRGVGAELSGREFGRLLGYASRIAERYWASIPSRRAFTRPPDEVVNRIRGEALPLCGVGMDEVLDGIERDVVPYPNGAGHPRWWGFVSASAHPAGIAAELVATTLNNYVHGTSQIATDVELRVVEWLSELVGLPDGSSGLLVSGGSMANLVALGAAREARAPGARLRGLSGLDRRFAVYASDQIHSCVGRALEVLGLGRSSLRGIPVDGDWRIDLNELREAIRRDRAEGVEPLAIVGSAGTVNTGAVDPLDSLADVAEETGAWFHVDGAYGGVAASLPELSERFRGIERADSVAVDPHKWLYVPVEAGAVLVRDPETLTAAFATAADYLTLEDGFYLKGSAWLADRGPQLSRSFRALKIWAVLRSLGVEGLRELWRKDMEVAREVRRLASEHPRLESMTDSDLSIFCVRYLPSSAEPNEFNRRLLDAIHRDGRFLVTPVILNSVYGLRGCVVNFRSTLQDARDFVAAVAELGEELEGHPSSWRLAAYR